MKEAVLPATGSIASRSLNLNLRTKGREDLRGHEGQRERLHGDETSLCYEVLLEILVKSREQ
jgi:hypothetical protein